MMPSFGGMSLLIISSLWVSVGDSGMVNQSYFSKIAHADFSGLLSDTLLLTEAAVDQDNISLQKQAQSRERRT